jgi:hypothetical protein
MDKFTKDHILQAGVNKIEALWNPEDQSAESKLTLVQTAAQSEFPTLRYHKMEVGFYGDRGELIYTKELLVEDKETNEFNFDNSEGRVKAIFPNTNHFAYILTILDLTSEQFFVANYANISDDFARVLILKSFYDKTFSANGLTSPQFMDLTLEVLKSEFSPNIMPLIFRFLDFTLENLLPQSESAAYYSKAFNAVHQHLLTIGAQQPSTGKTSPPLKFLAESKKDQETNTKTLQSTLISLTRNVENFSTLQKIYSKEDPKMTHIDFTLEEQWKVVSLMHASKFSTPAIRAKALAEINGRDGTNFKELFGYAIRVFNANETERLELWDELWNCKNGMILTKRKYGMLAFNSHWFSPAQRKGYNVWFWERILDHLVTCNAEISNSIFTLLTPRYGDYEELVGNWDRFIAEALPKLKVTSGLHWKAAREMYGNVQNNFKVRKFAEANGGKVSDL